MHAVVAAAAGREQERPWIADHVHTPAARDFPPGATRKRPLIYMRVAAWPSSRCAASCPAHIFAHGRPLHAVSTAMLWGPMLPTMCMLCLLRLLPLPCLCRYELPSEYSTLMVQYRYGGEDCVPRSFSWDNTSLLSGG